MPSRIVQLCDQHGDFVAGDDGFIVFWPRVEHGSYRSNDLRSIAAELDKRNTAVAATLSRATHPTGGSGG